MIIGLLHGRLLGAPPGGGIIATPGYLGVQAYRLGATSASATASFSMNPDGTWSSTGSGYSADSGLWFDPATGGAGAAYEVRITPVLVSGPAAVLTNPASGWVALSSVRPLQAVLQRFTNGTSTSVYNIAVDIRLTGGAIVSTGTFPLTCTAEVDSGGGGGGECPTVEMWFCSGLIVEEAGVGRRIDAVHSNSPEKLTQLAIVEMSFSVQPCYRLVTTNGAACELSDSTPFTLRDGSSRLVSEMLGEEVLRDDGCGGLVWDTVVICHPVGMKRCAKVNIGGHSLLAGENPRMRIVSHNAQKV